MNFFLPLFKSKLDAMRTAAPRASIHLLHESNGFSIYLDEATAVRKVTQLGTLTDHAEDILEETVPVLFIPLEQCVKFVEEVTPFHSVGLVDVILADKVHAARYVMYAYFGKRTVSPWPQAPSFRDDLGMLLHPPAQEEYDKPEARAYVAPTQEEYDRMVDRCHRAPIPEFLTPVVALPEKLAEKVSLDADFWG